MLHEQEKKGLVGQKKCLLQLFQSQVFPEYSAENDWSYVFSKGRNLW